MEHTYLTLDMTIEECNEMYVAMESIALEKEIDLVIEMETSDDAEQWEFEKALARRFVTGSNY